MKVSDFLMSVRCVLQIRVLLELTLSILAKKFWLLATLLDASASLGMEVSIVTSFSTITVPETAQETVWSWISITHKKKKSILYHIQIVNICLYIRNLFPHLRV